MDPRCNDTPPEGGAEERNGGRPKEAPETGGAPSTPLGKGRAAAWRQVLYLFLTLVPLALTAVIAARFHYRATRSSDLFLYRFPWTAQWIGSPYRDSKTACFRKELFVSGRVDAAYVAVSADNFFRLQVNNKTPKPFFNPKNFRTWVGRETLYSSHGYPRTTGAAYLYNIRPFLKPGRNVVAVMVQTDDQTPRLALQGMIDSGQRQTFAADGSWKCAPHQVRSSAATWWYLSDYDDGAWGQAVPTGRAVDLPVDGDVAALEEPLRGAFIGGGQDRLAESVRFRRSFDLPGRIRDGWLRISTTARYDMLLNGRSVASTAQVPEHERKFWERQTQAEGLGRVQHSGFASGYPAAWVSRRTHVYLVRNFLQKGVNRLEVTLHARETPELRDPLTFQLDGKLR